MAHLGYLGDLGVRVWTKRSSGIMGQSNGKGNENWNEMEAGIIWGLLLASRIKIQDVPQARCEAAASSSAAS